MRHQQLAYFSPSIRVTGILAFALLCTTAAAQHVPSEESQSYYKMGMEVFDYNHRKQATDLFLMAIQADPQNARAYFMAGKSILLTINKDQSLPYLRQAFKLDPEVDSDLMYYLGEAYHHAYMFDSAIATLLKYKYKIRALDLSRSSKIKEAERRIAECRTGKVLVANPVDVKLVNLGAAINSEYPDYAPTINGDETLLVFTSRRPEGNMNPRLGDDYEYFEDIYYSQKQDGLWQPALNIGEPLNTKYHNSNISITSDGKDMFLYSDEHGGDIFLSAHEASGRWSSPKALSDINSPYLESSATMSADGNTLYFTSNRPGGSGGTDIYVAKRRGNQWTDITNLGSPLNTEGDEDAVFLASTGKTLYFSSNGHQGMGDLDIYQSSLDSITAKWQAPVNMGYPINSVENDIYFVLSGNGQSAYISSARQDNRGEQDIYRIDMRSWYPNPPAYLLAQAAREQEPTVVIVKQPVPRDSSLLSSRSEVIEVSVADFTVSSNRDSVEVPPANSTTLPYESTIAEAYIEVLTRDKDTGEPIEAEVTLMKPNGKSKVFGGHDGGYSTRYRTDSLKMCHLRVASSGYRIFESDTLFRAMSDASLSFTQTIMLSRMASEAEEVVTIYFALDSTVPETWDELKALSSRMKADPFMKLTVRGYTDDMGPEEYNQMLSERRAEQVKDYIAKRGVEADRIATKGFGEQYPASPNDSRESRKQNRRVELIVGGL